MPLPARSPSDQARHEESVEARALRDRAAEAEREGDKWQRWANEAFGRGHARMGQSYADRAAWHYGRVSRLGEEAAELERIAARWPPENTVTLEKQDA